MSDGEEAVAVEAHAESRDTTAREHLGQAPLCVCAFTAHLYVLL